MKPRAYRTLPIDFFRNRSERTSVGGGRTAGTAIYNAIHEDSEECSAEAAALRSEAGVGEHSSRHRQTALLWLASLSRFPGTTLREPTSNHGRVVGFERGLLARIALALFYGLFCLDSSLAGPIQISDYPAVSVKQPDPNLMFTIDDSGSMFYTTLPRGQDLSDPFMVQVEPEFMDANKNKIAYDPTQVYSPPLEMDAAGAIKALPDVDFYAAPLGGLNAYYNQLPYHVAVVRRYTSNNIDLSKEFVYTIDYDVRPNPGTALFPARYFVLDKSCRAADVYECYVKAVVGPITKYYGWKQNCTSRVPDRCWDQPRSAPNGLVAKDERKNFANWFSYYSRRAYTAMTSLMTALTTLPSNFRVGCHTYNYLPGANESLEDRCNIVPSLVKKFSGTHRADFFKKLGSLKPDGETPGRTALYDVGQYFKKTGVNSPWAYEPGVTKLPELACRRSYNIVITDGFWNTDPDLVKVSVGNLDGGNGISSFPDGKTYPAGGKNPYADNNDHTMADIAFKYWAADLRPDLPNKVPARNTSGSAQLDARQWPEEQYWNYRNDPATWQHLNNYTIGFGISGKFAYRDPTVLAALAQNGRVNWPDPSGMDAATVDDLWHTAVNSRGEYYSAATAAEVQAAFSSIIQQITVSEGSGAAPAASGNNLSAASDSALFVGGFIPGNWMGKLLRYDVRLVGPDKNVEVVLSALEAGEILGRRVKNKGHRDRKILMGARGLDFNEANIPPLFGLGKDMVDYLRGDGSKELRNGGGFRDREQGGVGRPLGDIVNSAPMYLGPVEYTFDYLAAPESNYLDYVAKKRLLSDAGNFKTVFVGANDGMLHAFDAKTLEERFAYVPADIVPKMKELVDPAYNGKHKFFVDGQITLSDAYWAGGWHSVLLGATGAGSRTVFALDVTNPNNPQVLWEKMGDDSDPDLKHLGFVLGKPRIARLRANDKWVALVPNGINSKDARAVLLIFDLQTGAFLGKLDTTKGDPDSPNGLLSVGVLDTDEDVIDDLVFAGDYQGNLWEFDLRGSTSNDWKINYSNTPLFTAKGKDSDGTTKPQPIFSAPAAVRHPERGYMILFGTGEMFTDGASDKKQIQSLYGLWRKADGGKTLDKGDLIPRLILKEDKSGAANVRLVSSPEKDKEIGKPGWYIDLALQGAPSFSGERVILTPNIFGPLVQYVTVKPGSDPCEGAFSSWIMALNPFTGSGPDVTVIDTNGDGTLDQSDIQKGGLSIGGSEYPKGVLGMVEFNKTDVASGATGIQSTVDSAGGVKNTKIYKPVVQRRSWRSLFR